MRQIVLDTETTGIDPKKGHKIIEIGCVELINRKLTGRHYHQYINPNRQVEQEAIDVHGITNEFLEDKPLFTDIVDEFLAYCEGAELVIHNAPFDVGFINHEIHLLNKEHTPIDQSCQILDTLGLARTIHPGQRNSLDALCKRYAIDNSHRELHGALLDSEILADVYLRMTGGQTSLSLSTSQNHEDKESAKSQTIRRVTQNTFRLTTIHANQEELAAHEKYLNDLEASSGETAIWKR